ncbi:MAG TPA: histidine decarboxylase [Thioploca sp.]|nr:MAG: histidine decarboxylase [Gammaproteobacteria bacterium]HDN26656.1 histidine decarboxylase [Thioploca sp.]
MLNISAYLTELEQLRNTMIERRETAIGVPVNLAANYQSILPVLGDVFLNNIGDIFVERKRSFSTHTYEQKVLSFFAQLYALAEDEWWGYITSGSTEGNMYGLWLARERYPQGMLYYSADSHYSINKIARILRMNKTVIPSLDNGEINYHLLEQAIQQRPSQAVIINLNVGTTMKGAIDNLELILSILEKYHIRDFHIHCDAALFGGFLPFLESVPAINFTQPISSMAISGYKFIGSPIPCGIILTRKNLSEHIKQAVEYISSWDTTITGSRNGHTPLILWFIITTKGYEGLQQEARMCVQNARIFYEQLTALSYPCFLNVHSNILVLKKPSDTLVEKWRLLTEGDWSHIVVMPHVTYEKFIQFLHDLTEEVVQCG